MVELIVIYLFHGICRSYLSMSIPLMSLCALLVQPFWFARDLQVQWTIASDSALHHVSKFCARVFGSRANSSSIFSHEKPFGIPEKNQSRSAE
jgi:hypothetical protein